MRIIHVNDSSIYNYDGISTYVHELLECAERNNDEVLLLTTKELDSRNKRELKYKGRIHFFPCVRFPGKPKFVTVFTFGLKKIITDFNPDIIWIHTIGTLGVKAAKVAGDKYKIIYTKHCFDGELWCTYLNVPEIFQPIFYSFAQFFENKILSKAFKILYHIGDVSRVEKSKFFRLFKMMPPPLNAKFFEQPDTAKKNSTANKIILGFCGRCDMDKGIREMFQGIEIFHHTYPMIEIDFHFIGDGPEAHFVKQKYDFINVSITGYINDVIPHLDKLDAFILSSKQETISLSSLEAYARKLIIFSVHKGYLSERVNDINNFFLFDTPTELAALIAKVFVTKEIRIAEHSEKVPPVISYAELYSAVRKLVEKI